MCNRKLKKAKQKINVTEEIYWYWLWFGSHESLGFLIVQKYRPTHFKENLFVHLEPILYYVQGTKVI